MAEPAAAGQRAASRLRLLWSFLPLIAFYVFEALWGLRAGLLIAIACALAEAAFQLARHRRIDRMVLFSTGLVVGLCGLSLLSDDDRFVLVSPIIGDAVFAAILLVTVWRGEPLLIALARQSDPELIEHPLRRRFLAGMTWRLALNLLVHAAAVAWSMPRSRGVWLFVSGPLQYILFGAQLAGELAYARLLLLPRIEASEDEPGQ